MGKATTASLENNNASRKHLSDTLSCHVTTPLVNSLVEAFLLRGMRQRSRNGTAPTGTIVRQQREHRKRRSNMRLLTQQRENESEGKRATAPANNANVSSSPQPSRTRTGHAATLDAKRRGGGGACRAYMSLRRRGQRCGSHPSLMSFKELAKDYRNLPEDEKERLRVIGNRSTATHRVGGLYHGER